MLDSVYQLGHWFALEVRQARAEALMKQRQAASKDAYPKIVEWIEAHLQRKEEELAKLRDLRRYIKSQRKTPWFIKIEDIPAKLLEAVRTFPQDAEADYRLARQIMEHSPRGSGLTSALCAWAKTGTGPNPGLAALESMVDGLGPRHANGDDIEWNKDGHAKRLTSWAAWHQVHRITGLMDRLADRNTLKPAALQRLKGGRRAVLERAQKVFGKESAKPAV